MLKGKHILIIAAVAISVVTAAGISLTNNKSSERDPMPAILMLYEGKEIVGSLRGYAWQGTFTPPNPGFDFPPSSSLVSSGSSEFTASLGEQPSYYLITIMNTTDPTNEDVVIEDVRLDSNRFVVDLDPDKYFVSLTGVWVRIDLFGRDGYRNLCLHNQCNK